MYNIYMLLNQKSKDSITFLLLLASLFWMKEINFLFYDSTQSPDFKEYFVYFDHFANTDLNISREHGLMYYYLHYINYFINYNSFANFDMFFHKSIQEVNFWIYIYGLFGYFKLLKFFKFSNSNIFLTFTFLNFFPVSIVARLVLKPEILAFSILPWILFCIEKYKSKNQLSYLYLSVPLLISCITLKGNILAIICIYLFLTNLKLIIKIKKLHLFSITFLAIISFVIISNENSAANEKNILDVQSGATFNETYNNKAPVDVLYKINLFDLVTSPIKNYHADSFIGITLLETSGDYFDLYWNNDSSGYFKSRAQIIDFQKSPEIKAPTFNKSSPYLIIYTQKDTDFYMYPSIGLVLSLFFYFYLFKHLVTKSDFRFYILAFLIGGFLLVIHAVTGIPVNNFDPNVGDTFKPHYYSFLFLLRIVFFISSSLRNSKRALGMIAIYIMSIIFILGFPKTPSDDLNQNISYFVEYSDFCTFENNIYQTIYQIDSVECFDKKAPENLLNYEDTFFKNKFEIKPINLFFIISCLLSSFYLSVFRRNFK